MATHAPRDEVAGELLQRAHAGGAAAMLRERVQQRPLLLRASGRDAALDARAKRRHARLQAATAAAAAARRTSGRPKRLSAQQRRALGVHEVAAAQRRYALYEPLHALWCGYMRGILGLGAGGGRAHVDAAGAGALLVSADYHGALVEVVRSRCPSRVGLRGIVVKDTKFTWQLVTARDELKLVPKEHTVVRFALPFAPCAAAAAAAPPPPPPLVFELHGDQFKTRAPDRANKKFKTHIALDL